MSDLDRHLLLPPKLRDVPYTHDITLLPLSVSLCHISVCVCMGITMPHELQEIAIYFADKIQTAR